MQVNRIFQMLGICCLWTVAAAAGVIPNRYLVELDGAPVADLLMREQGVARANRMGLRSAAARQHRSRVLQEQRRIRPLLESRHARILGSADTIANLLFVEIPDAEAASLRSIAGVKRVQQERQYKPLLDRAVVLQKVDAAWQQIGIDNAGLGVKIGILDTGIESRHPAFQDPSLPILPGYPQITREADRQYTSNKIIVARSYARFFENPDPDQSVRDHIGHGTAVASVAAGVTNTGPLATITGIAPKAYLGVYKIAGTPGVNDGAGDFTIIRAAEDAASDGMDVINLSFGADLFYPVEDDISVDAFQRVAARGVIVVTANGNAGPGLGTVGSPALSASVLGVGATNNDRLFGGTASVETVGSFTAIPAFGSVPRTPVSGPLRDVSTIDATGLACSALPANSLRGYVAFVQRQAERCTTTVKLRNLLAAGATGALLYQPEGEDLFNQTPGTINLPAEVISYADGLAVLKALQAGKNVTATLDFTIAARPVVSDTLASYSSLGPTPGAPIKPDLVAVGSHVYLAAETLDRNGELYSADGYAVADGTSFAAPMVAGAAALLKSARPGLTPAQYSSLLVNNTAVFLAGGTQPVRVQQAGSGLLDVFSALRANVTATPTNLTFGVAGYAPKLGLPLTLTNIGGTAERYSLTVVPRTTGPAPILTSNTLQLASGASETIAAVFTNTVGLAPGAYEGFVRITVTSTGQQSHLAYWYAVPGAPKSIQVLGSDDLIAAGTFDPFAIAFRVLDENGIALTQNIQPTATVVSGGGEVTLVNLRDQTFPGAWGVNLRLGTTPGANVFRIQAGAATADVTINSVRPPA